MRLYVLHHGGGNINEFLHYVRSRLRVARATTINVLIGGFVAALALRRSPWAAAVMIAATVGLFAVTYYAWVRIQHCYDNRIQQAHDIIKSEQSIKSAQRRRHRVTP